MKNTVRGKFSKIRTLLCALLAMLAAVCAGVAFALMQTVVYAEDTTVNDETGLIDAITAVNEYEDEKIIYVGSNISVTSAVKVGAAKTIRFVAASTADEPAITFTKGLEIKEEATLTFDVDVVFNPATTTDGVTVTGTLVVNNKLYNAGNVIVNNKYSAYAELPSRGVIVGGSFNNDATNGGSIQINSGATFTTQKSTEYSIINESGDTETPSNNDGGTLMLKAGTSTETASTDNGYKSEKLNLTINGALVNDGSVIYDKSETVAPVCASDSVGALVGATFRTETGVPEDAGTYVIALSAPAKNADGYPSTTVDLETDVELSNEVNLLSFGKITYKIKTSGSNVNFAVSNSVSLGGGTDGTKHFTQGANQLIFDGGAQWEKDANNDANNSKVDYDRSDSSVPQTGIIFYDENNEAHYYKSDFVSATNSDVDKDAFFCVTGSSGNLSMYGGTTITNFYRTFGSDKEGGKDYFGGGVYVGTESTFNMYGGEISRCAVNNVYNGAVGAGVYVYYGTANIYGGKVTHNAAATVSSSSADGAGIAVMGKRSAKDKSSGNIKLYGGEISYNHSALGNSDINADGGGLMLDRSVAKIYGGLIHGNFAGGSGGGICAWNAALYMTGGEISENIAAYGGGIGTTSNNKAPGGVSEGNQNHTTDVTIKGGSILNNKVFQNDSATHDVWGGYGGGIGLGSSQMPNYSYLAVSGDTLISGNKAFYGGGLAVYSENGSISNQLTMSGGLISGNAAYQLSSTNAYAEITSSSKPLSQNGGAIYVQATGGAISRAMLLLSGKASIDSSNAVSFNVAVASDSVAPINVNGELTGSGLGALIYLQGDTIRSDTVEQDGEAVTVEGLWYNKPLIDVSATKKNAENEDVAIPASTYLNKFVLDTNADQTYTYWLTKDTNDKYIYATYAETEDTTKVAYLARYNGTGYPTLKAAVAAIPAGATDAVIKILKSATLSAGQILITGNRNITIKPAEGLDVTLIIAAATDFVYDSLLRVDSGSTLNLVGENGTGSRLTIDGNGNGRALEKTNPKPISLVEVIDGGTFTMGNEVYLRNNVTTRQGSAVIVSGNGTFTMSGGVIEDNTSNNATGSAVYLQDTAQFNWNGGSIANNVTAGDINYGIYLSSNNNVMYINTTTAIKLTNNSIYIGTAKINVTSLNCADGEMGLVFADVNSLIAGSTVVSMGTTDYSAKFKLAQEQEGLFLGTSKSTDNKYSLIILRTVNFVFNARYGVGHNDRTGISYGDISTLIDGKDGINKPIYSGEEVIGYSVEAKIKQGGYEIFITMRSDETISAETVESISDFYTRDGYYISGYNDNASGYTFSLSYRDSREPITFNATWTDNKYSIEYSKNEPAGVGANDVTGSLPKLKEIINSDISDNDKNGVTTDIGLVGFVFSGWNTQADGSGKAIFANGKITTDDLKHQKDTTTRGTYSLSAYAVWTPIFGGGIGSSNNPFIIGSQLHLGNLQATLPGNAVTLTLDGSESVTYPAKAINGYSGKYFKLNSDITLTSDYTLSDTAFAGFFDGDLHTVTLAGKPLFNALSGAKISNILFAGSVSDTASVGALAKTAVNSSIDAIANNAAVGSASSAAVAGGIIGEMTGGYLATSFNCGTVNSSQTAGGLVGKMTGGNLSSVYNTGAVGATGTVDAESCAVAGGLVGEISNVQMASAYNAGTVKGASYGAIAGQFTGGSTLSSVYYNSDKVGNGGKATPLTSSKMYVAVDDVAPAALELTGSWKYEVCTEDGYYYPQLSAFVGNEDAQALSRASVKIKDVSENPVTPEQQFTVTFNANGGAFGSSATQTTQVKLGGIVPKPTEPTRTGYTFAHWCTDSEGNTEYDFDSGVSAMNITLYAKWNVIEYRITYVLNDSSNKATLSGTYNEMVSVENDAAHKVALATGENAKREGYEFNHWTFANKPVTHVAIIGGEVVFFNGDTRLSEKLPIEGTTPPIQLYADWNIKNYTITYTFKGVDIGAVTNDNRTKYQIVDTFRLYDASATGYTFKYWTTSPDGDASGKIDIITERHGDLALCGVFEANVYRIYFNPGEGTAEKASSTNEKIELDEETKLYYGKVAFGQAPSFNGSDVTTKRTGYTSKGWFRTIAGENAFDFTAAFSYSDNVTLYQKYEIITHSVTVNAGAHGGFTPEAVYKLFSNLPNGWHGTYDNSTDVEDGYVKKYTISGIPYGTSAYDYLLVPTIKTDGQYFNGWGDKFSEVVSGNITELGYTIIVTAQYSVRYSVTLSYNGTSKSFEVDSTTQKITYTADPEDLNIVGYDFGGWYRDLNFSGDSVDFETATFDKSTVLFAKYTPKPVTVTFTVPDACSLDGDVTYTFTAPKGLNYESALKGFADPVYNGYRFLGWFDGTDAAANRVSDAALSTLLPSDGGSYSLTVYGRWEEIEYTVTFVTDGSTVTDIKYQYSKTFGSGVTINQTTKKTGYEFKGWQSDKLTSDKKLAAGTYGNLTLTAKWQIKSYKVTFTAGEGTFNAPEGDDRYKNDNTYEILVEYKKAATPPVDPVRTGYKFKRWDTAFNSITDVVTVTAEYEISQFDLYLDGNGGTVSKITLSVDYNANVLQAITADGVTCSRTGYDFNGWAIGNVAVAENYTMPANNVTLVAQWIIKKFSVTIDVTGNYAASGASKIVAAAAGIKSENTAVTTSDLADGGKRVVFTVDYDTVLTALNITDGTKALVYKYKMGGAAYNFGRVQAKVELTAEWSESVYKIILHSFGTADDNDNMQILAYSTGAENITLPVPALNGYEFGGWYTDFACTSEKVTLIDTLTSDRELYAKWTAIKYDIKYNLDGGTNDSDNPSEYTIKSDDITLQDPTKEGYNFAGWTDIGGKTVDKIASGSVGHKVLNANWSAKEYNIVVSNYTTNVQAATTKTVTLTFGGNLNALLDVYNRPYHNVTLKFDDESEFDIRSNATVPALETLYSSKMGEGNTFNVTAGYSEIEYIISYLAESDTARYNYTDKEVELNLAYNQTLPEGQQFDCWGAYIQNTLTGVTKLTFVPENDNVVLTLASGGTAEIAVGTVTLYPVLKAKEYTVSFVTHAEFAMEAMTLKFREYKPLTKVTGSNKGYSFVGWSKTEGGEVVYLDGGAIMLEGSEIELTLHAIWKPVEYSITYNLNGEGDTVSHSNPASYTVQSDNITLDSPVRAGYEFKGWFENAGLTGNAVSVIDVRRAENVTLYAEWAVKSFTVTFDPDHGQITGVSSKTVEYRTPYGELPTAQRSGYNFGGWKLDGVLVTKEDKMTTSDNHTLVAEWSAISFRFEYDLADGTLSGTLYDGTLSYGGTTLLTLPAVAKTGYNFLGWKIVLHDTTLLSTDVFNGYATLDDILAIYNATTIYNDTSITFKATFSAPIEYTISYILNGGTNASDNPNIYKVTDGGDTHTINIYPATQTGYSMQWFDNPNFSGSPVTQIDASAAQNITLYAKWTPETYAVTVWLDKDGNKTENLSIEYNTNLLTKLYEYQRNELVIPAEHNFVGWTDNDGIFLTSFILKGAMTIKASFNQTHVGITKIDQNGAATIELHVRGNTYPLPNGWRVYGTTPEGWNETNGWKLNSSMTIIQVVPQTFSLIFDINGSNTTHPGLSFTFGTKYGSLKSFPTNVERAGYTFIGWYVKDTDIVVTEETLVSTSHIKDNKITLEARWTPIYYNVVFKIDSVKHTFVCSVTDNFTAPAFSETGYSSCKWMYGTTDMTEALQTTTNLGEEAFRSILQSLASSTTITFTLEREAIEYTVNFELAGGTSTSAGSVTAQINDSSSSISLPTVTKTGHDFAGWKVNLIGNSLSDLLSVGSSNAVELITLLSIANVNLTGNEITLTAQWTAKTYTITYVLGKVGATTSAPESYTYGTTVTLSSSPATCKGYTFEGWYVGETKVTQIESTSTGNKSFTAHWTPVDYTFVFDGNGGELKPGSSQLTGNSMTVNMDMKGGIIALPTAVRQGYTFSGWELSGNTTIKYSNSISLGSIIANSDDTTFKFEAVWSNAVYTINYDLEGGSFINPNNYQRSHMQSEPINLPNDNVRRANYVLAGWFYYDNTAERHYVGLNETVINGITYDVLIHADWRCVEVTVENEAGSDTAKFTVEGTDNPYSVKVSGNVYKQGSIIVNANLDKFAVWYGVKKPAPNRMRARSAEPQFDFNNYNWFNEAPVDAGEYKVLICFKHDGNENTVAPDEENVYLARNGWIVLNAIIGKAENSISNAGDLSFVYGSVITFAFEAEEVTSDNFSLEFEVDGKWVTSVPVNAGSYKVRVTSGATRNYNQAENEFAFTITKKNVKVAASGEGVYGDEFDSANVNLTFDGLVEGDSITIPLAYGEPDGRNVGEHSFTIGYTASDRERNYELIFPEDGGVYNITPRPFNIVISDISSVFGTAVNLENVDYKHDKLVEGDSIAALGLTFNTTATRYSNVGGVYPITCTSNSENYDVIVTNGYYKVEALELSLEIIMEGGLYGSDIAEARVAGIKNCSVSGIDLDYIEEIVSNLQFRFMYTGRYPDGIYNRDEVPSLAGSYYVTADLRSNNANLRVVDSGTEFNIYKVANSLGDGKLTIQGWTYGEYDASVNSPSILTAAEGEVYFTYSTEINGVYTTTVPTNGIPRTYYVRAEIAETYNHTAYVGTPVAFEISKVKVAVPTLELLAEGANRNTVYTGLDLHASVKGFNSAIMDITFENVISEDGKVTVVAHNANTYVVKFRLIDTGIYEWADDAVKDGGYAVRKWTVERCKVTRPVQATQDISITGLYITFIPEGFDPELMEIRDNVQAFAGAYTAYIALLDTENYVWDDGSIEEIAYEWNLVGVNKIFLAIVITSSALIALSGAFSLGIFLNHKRMKKRSAAAVDQMSDEPEAEHEDVHPTEETAAKQAENGKEGK